MTAVLAAAVRYALAAALLAVTLASLLLPAYGPRGAWPMAWTGVVFVVVSCAVPAWIALQPKGDSDA
jgi:hypothetical protein